MRNGPILPFQLCLTGAGLKAVWSIAPSSKVGNVHPELLSSVFCGTLLDDAQFSGYFLVKGSQRTHLQT